MRSERYLVPRLQLAYLGVGGYLKTFWWFAGTIPAFGILCLLLGEPTLKLIGIMALLWPVTLPARAIVSSSKASRLFGRGVVAEFIEGVFFFHGDDGKGMKLSITAVRGLYELPNYFVLQTRMGGIVPISRSALGPDEDEWRKAIRDGIASWRDAPTEA